MICARRFSDGFNPLICRAIFTVAAIGVSGPCKAVVADCLRAGGRHGYRRQRAGNRVWHDRCDPGLRRLLIEQPID